MLRPKHLAIFLFLYAVLRIFSFFFGPATPLYPEHPLNTALALLALVVVGALLITKEPLGWTAIALEFILGGSGGYLAVSGISLRTLLLVVCSAVYVIRRTLNGTLPGILKRERAVVIALLVLYAAVALAAARGVMSNHAPALIMRDAIPYLFFLYYFPLREFLNANQSQKLIGRVLFIAVLGNALLVLLTLGGFATGLLVLQDSYYHWYRDVAAGKITELPFHFFRLVLDEHLLLVPLLLYALGSLIRETLWLPRRALLALAGMLLIILGVNLTRIYLVAGAVGFLCLFSRARSRSWMQTGAGALLCFISVFTLLHTVVSRGASPGWELFGIRLGSIVAPKIEESSLSRLLLLPKIVEKIKTAPIVGSGLGDTVTVFSPVFKKDITTSHFDWGYLEIVAEMGLLGLVAWLALVLYLLRALWPNRPLFASLIALLVINITSPALFHVFGIVWITFLLARTRSLQ